MRRSRSSERSEPGGAEPTGSVVVVGDVVTDVLAVLSGPIAVGSDTPASVSFGGGGAGANTAAWLAAAGVPVRLVAVVGADDAGDARLAELTAGGVDLAVRRVSRATGTIVVLATADERSMVTDRGANLLLEPSDVDAALAGATHLHLSGYTLLDPGPRPAGLHALAAARAHGMTTSVDAASAVPLRGLPGFLDLVRGTDLLFANASEAAVLGSLDAAVRVAAVVKRGPDGADWIPPDGPVVTVPGEPATVVDPTGAGDAFAAGLLSAWLSGADPETALRAGTAFGARAVAQPGARPPAALR